MKIRTIVIMLLSAPAFCAVAGPDSGVYTLEECLRIGLQRSGVAEIARHDRAIARSRVVQARADALPSISLQGDYTRLDELQDVDLGDGSVELGTLDNYSLTAEIRQVLYGGGRVFAVLRAARVNEDYAEWSRRHAESKLVRDICLAFYDILLAERTVAVRKATVEQLSLLHEQVAQKQRKGAASEFELLSARVRMANERPALIEAKNARALAITAFKRLVNLEAGAFRAEGELICEREESSLAELVELALENRPLLKVLANLVELRGASVTITKADGRPELSTTFNYSGQNSYGFVSFEDEWQWHWNAGLALSWTLWDGGLVRGRVREGELELAKARVELREMERTVKLEVQQAYLEMQHAAESLDAGRGTVELAKKALAIAEVRHGAGLATHLEFTDAAVELSRARLAVAIAQQRHMAAVARLRYACGVNLNLPREND